MNIKINQKIIKEMCGIVSFKKGDSFYRSNNVTFKTYNANHCDAIVSGSEDFYVNIKKDSNGGILTKCSCPKLASFQKNCQHIAAVLLSIHEHQLQGTMPIDISEQHSKALTTQDLTEGLLTLFNNQPKRSSNHQLYFEKRQALDVKFTCKPVYIGQGQFMFGIEVKIGSTHIANIRDFLEKVNEGIPILLSISFTYDQSTHCIQNEADAVVQQLIQIVNDEQLYINELSDESNFMRNNHILLIPPSSWARLLPILKKAPALKLEYDGIIYDGIRVSNERLSIQFDISEAENSAYELRINGIDQLVVLNSYSTVISEGKVIKMKSEDCNRLSDLKKMLNTSGSNSILIPYEQIDIFLEKVVPGLKRLGDVQLPVANSKNFDKSPPLIAKLYLDRVKNRLLAGLEFHYGNIIIDPFESRQLLMDSMIIREVEKENVILQMIEDSLFIKTDGGYFLHNEELEYSFLYHVIPQIQNLVEIYATTAVRNRIFRENARPRIRVKVQTERTNWLEFKFEMDGIPEKHIRDILLALEEKRKYYRLRNGSLLSLETREFEEIRRFLNASPVQNENLEDGLYLPIVKGLQLFNSVDEQSFTLEESFKKFLENIRNPGSLEFQVPNSLESILRDYQKRGYKWMKTLSSYGFGGILADDMGLGKTLQSIAFIQSELKEIQIKNFPVLVVCPSSLTYNWLNEFTKFTPNIQAVVIDGNKTERTKKLKIAMEVDVVIISYPLLRRDIMWFEKQTFHTVFFDEAQAFKNHWTQTAQVVKKIQADYRFALTGTPVENSLEELWSIFHVVFPELFMGLKEYSNLSKETIARRIRPFLLRRLKEDVLSELPDKIESIESIELLPDQKKLYAAYLAKLRHDTLKHLDKDGIRKNRIKILAGLTRLRQICCHPALFVDGYKGSSAKFEQLLQIVEESQIEGRRVLIFSQFTKMLELIGRELAIKGHPYFYLDGKTPSKERVDICNQFNDGERDLFLISLKAGGTGLNLTGADTVILYDNWWNPAVEEQAADRAHRIGQTNVVHVIKLVARGTIEEKMNELQDKKRLLIEEVFDSEGKVSSTLTEDDIRSILRI
ncbi:DEAD/DEAH box helicase [Paenisporosarcina sp. TG-14]|uniref:DEAD/DEAH box helicase n=1 Tax=Paenisporosarcina sp. TG-14 TaxID=1231057 RepID=UPI00031F2AA3|nr:DEAD/DEAH box helicase [Paenisporosarcina sp. TG-14]